MVLNEDMLMFFVESFVGKVSKNLIFNDAFHWHVHCTSKRDRTILSGSLELSFLKMGEIKDSNQTSEGYYFQS